jgi:general secretion pathway protein A
MRTTARLLPGDATRAFQPTANPASLWLTGQYDDALRMLRAAVVGRQGLLALVGESGTGKTVLAHALAGRVRDDAVVVGRLLYPILEGMDLLAAVAEAFGLPTTFPDRDGFVAQLRRFVADTAAGGRRVLLVVDEAQRLNRDLLVALGRLPYADGPAGAASLSVLFVGQRGLLDALRADALEPDVLCHLRPLSREQTAEYVAHRLRAAGYRGRLFTPSALRKIWVVSEGIPRAANTLCVDALTGLRHSERRTVTAAMIDRGRRTPDEATAPEAVVERPHVVAVPSARPPASRRRLASLASAAGLVLTLVAIGVVKHSDRAPRLLAGPVATTAAPVTDVAPTTENDVVRVPEGAAAEESAPAEAATPASLPERAERPALIAARPALAVPTPTGQIAAPAERRAPPEPGPATVQAADDGNDASSIIDWLLKGRRARGGTSRE